jgi:DNA-binding response OmpR family regulator
MKILIIEDEKALCETIVSYLKKEGYLVECALNYEKADEKISFYEYDCIIVDLTLPDGNGLDIIKQLKKNDPQTGIIIITAKNSLDDKLTGLDIGADDYLTKPFDLSELNARIKSVLRRRNFSGQKEIIYNEIKVIPELTQVFVFNQELTLTRKEYDLLLFLISNKNRVISKDTMAEHLWGEDMELADSLDFIYTHIKNLRKKILDKGGKDYIKTVYGIGYKFSDA